MAEHNLITAEQLKGRLDRGESVVLLDVRYDPKQAAYGRVAYGEGHLPGAAFVDFKAELTDPAGEHGGRSPLPSPDRLAERFGALGIDRETAVVVYETTNGPAAARLWWVLRYLGVEQTQVLDGGYEAWIAAGYPVTTEAAGAVAPRQLVPAVQADWLADVAEVRAASGARLAGERGVRLVDSRPADQYAGRDGGFDPVAGHIPGAESYFWKTTTLDEGGAWRSPEQLRERFAGLSPDDEIIVYCGSGISATPNVLALREAGYSQVKLYAGSWSDWISYSENVVATGEE